MSLHPSTTPTTAVGDYIVGQEIGRGSFATVYMGRAISTGRPVAVKSVSREKLNRKLAENLESEIRILKGIQHEHVVALLDIWKNDKHIHLIMEYCSLGDLSQYIKRRGIMPDTVLENGAWNPMAGPWGGLNEIVVRHFLRQLASAMEFLRAHNLIHRDLKPQNVLLSPASPDSPGIQISSLSQPGVFANVPALPVLKLADFGFARALPTHSLASTLCGSPLYMAPEILRGDKYGPSADLWSFGAILYEMICGRPPFKAQNYIDLLRKIERGEGIIRFPGEEMASMGGASRRNSALSSSPSARSLGTSPGSGSPRFPPGMKGVQPIGDDLKDLIRRLLKRNPAERMPFEAFFAHPCVISNRAIGSTPVGSFNNMEGGINMLRRKASTSSQRSVTFGTPPRGDPPFAHVAPTSEVAEVGAAGAQSEGFGVVVHNDPGLVPPTPLMRVHTSPARPGFRRNETFVVGMPHEFGAKKIQAADTDERGPVAAGRDQDHVYRYTSPLAGQPSIVPDMIRQTSAPVFHTLQDSGSGTPTPATHSFRASAVSGVPPFSATREGLSSQGSHGSGTSKVQPVEPPFPGYGGVDPAIFGHRSPLQTSEARGDNSQKEEQHSDVDDEQKVGDENNSSLSSLGSLELSEGDDPDAYDESTGDVQPGPQAVVSSGSGSASAKSDSAARFANDSKGSGGSGSGSAAGRASLEEYVVVEKRVVEVNWLADQVADAVGPSDHHGTATYADNSFPTAEHGNYGEQNDPFASSARTNAPGNAAGGTIQNTTSPHSSPRLLRLSPKQRSRIFGSLRESTHQFLNPGNPQQGASSGGSSQSGTTPPAAYLAAAAASASTSPTGRHILGRSPSMPHLQNSSQSQPQSSRLNPRAATTAEGYPQNHPLLTPLNLCALRGHAVQQLADTLLASRSLAEALGCYLLALRCYQTGMEVAKGIWNNVRGGTGNESIVSVVSGSMFGNARDRERENDVDLRVLSVGVQWVRTRFNECLACAERCQGAEERGARSVERVVYEGALEVSRRAAVLELSTPSALPQCEELYRHAILLVEALLVLGDQNEAEQQEVRRQRRDSATTTATVGAGAGGSTGTDGSSASLGDSSTGSMTMTDEDRHVLERFVASLWARVGAVVGAVGGPSPAEGS